MSFALTFVTPTTRNVKTRVFTDPAQYDTEVNAARGFSKSSTTRRHPPMRKVMDYKRNDDGKVRICLHHSSIPYASPNKTSHAKPMESRVKRKIVVDPAQFDVSENQLRHVSTASW
jgi:hypothetical protein